MEKSSMYELAESVVTDLAEETGELVVCGVKEERKGVFVISANDRYGFTESIRGETYHLHKNASGKSMLALCSDEEIQAVVDEHGLPRATPNTITDPNELFEEIERVRERGFAINDRERNEFRSIGRGFKDPNTGVIGAFTIGGPPKRISTEVLKDEYAEVLLGGVNDLEIQLKYIG
jgi:DNA-binding IclR family transcriptional regulator